LRTVPHRDWSALAVQYALNGVHCHGCEPFIPPHPEPSLKLGVVAVLVAVHQGSGGAV